MVFKIWGNYSVEFLLKVDQSKVSNVSLPRWAMFRRNIASVIADLILYFWWKSGGNGKLGLNIDVKTGKIFGN
jgi:hypothetical protein